MKPKSHSLKLKSAWQGCDDSDVQEWPVGLQIKTPDGELARAGGVDVDARIEKQQSAAAPGVKIEIASRVEFISLPPHTLRS